MRKLRVGLGIVLLVALVVGSSLPVGALPVGASSGEASLAEAAPGTVPADFAEAFADWDDHYWAADALGRLIVRGIIRGDGGRIWPDRHITKLEAVVMISRMYHWTGELAIAAQGANPPEWGRIAFYEGIARGLIRREPEANYDWNLDRKQTRLDAAVLLIWAARLEDEAVARSEAGVTLDFTDASAVPAEWRGHIDLAAEMGFIHGYPDGTFRPDERVTRAEWAALLGRLEEYMPPEPPDSPEPGDTPPWPGDPPPPPEGRAVRGTVASVLLGAAPLLQLEALGLGGDGYRLASDARVYRDGRAAEPRDLQPGDRVWLWVGTDDRIVWVSAISSGLTIVSGTVVATTDAGGRRTITVAVNDGAEVTYDVSAGALIDSRSGLEISFSRLGAGDEVEVRLRGGVAVHVRRMVAGTPH